MKDQIRNGFLPIISIYLLFCNISCSKDENSIETIATSALPTNLVWSITIVGADLNNPEGDGSGKIVCKASAENAVRYGFQIENGSTFENTIGELEYVFSLNGVNEYSVMISAYSSEDKVISISKKIVVAVLEDKEQTAESRLIWADEFDTSGAVSTSNWFSEIVPPFNGGWFNAEQQHYTNRIDNAYISNGTLKLIAKKENYTAFGSTKNYTSARLNSEFAFTYGRIEVRAKLPEGGGTWPAIWTLGSNLNTIGWPFCGEIDIMEHVGNNIGRISAAIHTPSSNGNTVNSGYTNIADATTAYHIYKVDWTTEKMDFYVDDILYYTYNPEVKNSATWPFDKDQFILLNIAMGGILGGNIDPNFEQAIMEIDYVRVYRN